MHPVIMRTFRAAQGAFPGLKTAKNALSRHGHRILNTPHEKDFRIIKRFSDPHDLFLDIGANQGQSIESILLFRRKAQIISFEPNPSLAAKLQARYARQPNITVHAAGLGDVPGTFTLYVPTYNRCVYDGLASIDRSEAENFLSADYVYGYKRSKLSIGEVQCRIETLDSLKLSPSFIKLDVQGYEYSVLLGGTETLARAEPVLLIEDYAEDPRIGVLLQKFGYKEYHLEGDQLRKGPGTSCNSLLITDRKIGKLT
ncbi:FkbM family methyltransferase [Microvirga calopogonii]|uniref:FkbM family methyltransferase n=1 Tax=Microvirga calopogonii TaxID=2078013 RepID=UPI000E0D0024|nr:FkbM family methyltransferase [Microvirga calopogonii]